MPLPLVNNVKIIARHFYNYYRVLRLGSRYPNLNIEMPTVIKFDELDAINIGNNVYIGPFSEIIVIENTLFSTVKGHSHHC